MITLQEAEAARAQKGDLLERLGAFAIEIQPAEGGYELIAHFPDAPPPDLPRVALARAAGRRVRVPLRGRVGLP